MSKYDKIIEEIEKRKYFILGDDPGGGWSKYSTWFEDNKITEIQRGAVFNEDKRSLIFTTFNANIENKQKIGNKIYYTNIEEYEDSNPPWDDNITNIQTVKFKIKIKPKTCSNWFNNGANIIKIENLYNLDTSDATDMDGMFANCENLTSLDLSSFDTSSVTSMFGMFVNCFKLSFLDISGFDTSNVDDMRVMFAACYSLKTLDLSNFDTSKILYIRSMFSSCRSLTSLDLSNFDISNITDLSYMFNDCQNLTSLDLSNFDTFNVINTKSMFLNCYKLETINVSNLFNVSNVQNGENMFLNCYSLVGGHGTIYDWEHTGVEYAVVDYYNESQRSGYFLNKWIVPMVVYAVYDSNDKTLIFFEDKEGKYREEQIIDTKTYYTNIETRELPLWNTKEIHKIIFEVNVKRIGELNYWFWDQFETLEEIIGLNRLDTSNVTDMSNMFYECKNLTELDLSNFDTSNVTNMSNMFYGCRNLIELNLSNFNTSNVTDMSNMFARCERLTELDLSNFNTFNVNDMDSMFTYCDHLTSLNISNFSTSNVTNMSYIFSNCSNLTSLDLSSFDTNNVTDMSSMFAYCSNLTFLDLSSFNTSNVNDMSNMFNNCGNLTSLDLSHFDTSKVIYMSYMFNNCGNLTATLNIMNMPTSYDSMCSNAARDSGQLTLKYIAPVTSANIDTLVATKNDGNVVNGGEA